MFLSDPALRRIAAETGDVWPEHLWRHDTATPGPTGVLATLLHTVTLRFNDNAARLDQLLATLGQQADSLRQATARHGSIPPSRLDRTATDLLDQIGRRVLLEQLLLDTYDAWHTHRQPEPGKDEQHLLLRPGDPAFGVATLRRLDEATWLVSPDAEAAAAFAIPYAARLVGEVTEHGDGWKPTAHSNPERRYLGGGLAYELPPQDDLVTACRTLLRWWALRHSAAWRNRRPEQLTETELADLAR
ncbi:hypothetical protein [Allorhizocola rhizosphaerae]|uniref:hypothetical protein n=1 Tax=Allorhizocola rhizosphaerae TaxID=1872709 RepID=UPI000E3C3191|nr:hypothetical protein [Allorhizocola rhizosphaerae]